MNRTSFGEKLQVAAVTATLVSAGWITFGALFMDWRGSGLPAGQQGSPAEAPIAEGSPALLPEAVQEGELIVPVAGIATAQLNDTYTDARGGGSRLHDAIDIMAPTGTPVVAAAPGTVERLFESDQGGLTIYVRSQDRRTIYYYAHLASYAAGLEEGQQVREGQRLGAVGSSGNADPAAPHLHFAVMRTTPQAEWYDPTTALNPYPLLVRQP